MGWVLSIWFDSNEPNLNIFRSDIAQIFRPCIDCIVTAILEQNNSAHKTISVSLYTSFYKYRFPNHHLYFQHVVLVGGFAASDWLFSKVHELLTPLGLNIVRPENHVWVLFEIKTTILFRFFFSETKLFRMARSHSTSTTSVRTRVSKFTYGIFCHTPYDPYSPDHKLRSHNVVTSDKWDWADWWSFRYYPTQSELFNHLPGPQKDVILYYHKPLIYRILKFRRRRNSENLISGN